MDWPRRGWIGMSGLNDTCAPGAAGLETWFPVGGDRVI